MKPELGKLTEVAATQLQKWLQEFLEKSGVKSVEWLRDDSNVNWLAQSALSRMPFTVRLAIRRLVSEKDFVRLFFQIRDGLVDQGTLDLSKLDLSALLGSKHSKKEGL